MNRQKPYQKHRQLNLIVAGFVLIAVGVLFLGHNTGYISSSLFHIFISWQMLLIVLGFLALLKGNIASAIISAGAGGFFLLPRIMDVGDNWIHDYWPLFLIIGGIGLLFTLLNPRSKRFGKQTGSESGDLIVDNGYIIAEANFNGVKHIVHDPVFKGAKLNVSFGSLALDLRRTHLEEEETFIDLHNSFSGVELFIPSSWNVIIQANASFGGIEDKRFRPQDIDYTHKLILRGNVSFGGVEIKS